MPRTVLQAIDPNVPVLPWSAGFPARTWKKVLQAGETVRVELEAESASLLAVRDGIVHTLLDSLHGDHAIELTDLDYDWIWPSGTSISSATYSISRNISTPEIIAIIPSFHREADATAQAARFSSVPHIAKVFIIDQGYTLNEYEELTALRRSEPKIEVIEQPNLGGSGGYARGMHEAHARFPHAAILMSDDDSRLSTETIRRMSVYQALSSHPTIIGTGLFSQCRPTVLTAHAETIHLSTFQWGPADSLHQPQDLAGRSPAEWDFLKTTMPVTYTGWWGTLLPPGTVSRLGLPAPYFLKWDDAEYGLRATHAGYDHVVIPGASAWQEEWSAYRTQMTWVAQILHRNRAALAATVAGPLGIGPIGFINHSLAHQIKHILAGHYITAELWNSGLNEASAGPHWLGSDLHDARIKAQASVERIRRRLTSTPPTQTQPFMPLTKHALLRSIAKILGITRHHRHVQVQEQTFTWRDTLGADSYSVLDRNGEIIETLTAPANIGRSLVRGTLVAHTRYLLHWHKNRFKYPVHHARAITIEAWTSIFANSMTKEKPHG